MNVFILNSGRCGSSTFIKACQHISNYSSAHESLLSETGSQRFDYPRDHIEADNRLSWLLGRLEQAYGDDAFYVHLQRDTQDTITSFARRIDFGILKAYEQGILMHDQHRRPAEEIARDYLLTVNSNIQHFLKNKPSKMNISLGTVKTDFAEFWHRIDAQGNLEAALKEWQIRYNASA